MRMRIVVPNEPVIKSYIDTSLRKQIAENNSKEKLKCFITIKYNLCEDIPKNTRLINNGFRESIVDLEKRFTNGLIFTLNSSAIIGNIQNQIIDEFNNDLEKSQGGSSFVLHSITELQIKTARSKPTVGGSYIELPDFIKNKKACVNIKNEDDKCFIWCLLAFFHHNTDVKGGCKDKATSYKKYYDNIKKPNNVSYPVDIESVPEFEKLNGLKINVFE